MKKLKLTRKFLDKNEGYMLAIDDSNLLSNGVIVINADYVDYSGLEKVANNKNGIAKNNNDTFKKCLYENRLKDLVSVDLSTFSNNANQKAADVPCFLDTSKTYIKTYNKYDYALKLQYGISEFYMDFINKLAKVNPGLKVMENRLPEILKEGFKKYYLIDNNKIIGCIAPVQRILQTLRNVNN